MHDFDIVRILLTKMLSYEATMTMFWGFFGAEETAVIEIGDLVSLVDTTLGH